MAGITVALAALSMLGAGSAEGSPGHTDHDAAGPPGGQFRHVPNLGPARRTPGGLLEVRAPNGKIFTTHGHDPIDGQELAPGTTEDDYKNDDRLEVESNTNTVYPSYRRDPVCASSGRIRLIYVQPADLADRGSTYSDMMRETLRAMNGWLYERGRAYSHGDMRVDIRTQCSATTGTVIVDSFRSRQNSNSVDFATLKTELRNAGFSGSNDKFLVMWDYPVWQPTGTATGTATGDTEDDLQQRRRYLSGVGDMWQDDRLAGDNRNNQPATQPESMFALVYGVKNFRDNTTALHETLHTMGAVQSGAPFATTRGHCFDELEVMCYDDDRNSTTFTIVNRCQNATIDCYNDTYYDTLPESGEWLQSHWNVGWSTNRFLRFNCVPDGRLPDNCT